MRELLEELFCSLDWAFSLYPQARRAAAFIYLPCWNLLRRRFACLATLCHRWMSAMHLPAAAAVEKVNGNYDPEERRRV